MYLLWLSLTNIVWSEACKCGKYAKEQRNQVVGKYIFTVCRLADLTVCQESEIKRGKVCHVSLFLCFRYQTFYIWHQQPLRNTVKLWNVSSYFTYLVREKQFLFLSLLFSSTFKCISVLSAFCTEWPSALETDTKCDEHFPIKLESKEYVSAGPSLRNPSARIVHLRVSFAIFTWCWL